MLDLETSAGKPYHIDDQDITFPQLIRARIMCYGILSEQLIIVYEFI